VRLDLRNRRRPIRGGLLRNPAATFASTGLRRPRHTFRLPRAAPFKGTARAADAAERGVTEMPALPSIKGSLFSGIAESVLKLVSSGQISRDELGRRLEPGDLEILDQVVQLTQWYDIRLYERLVVLLRDVEGGGHNEYLRQRGAAAAERLLKAGLYQQMEYLSRTQAGKVTDPKERFLAFGRDLRLLTTLSASLLNFSRWQVQPDPEWPDRYRIEISEATAYPEVLAWQTDGLMNRMATQHGKPNLWSWERVRPDLIVFRMTRSF